MKDSLNIAVAGATGYVGLELIKILSKHPKVKIVYLCANKSAGKKIQTFDKRIIKKNLPVISKVQNINWNKIEVLFTALPNGEAQKIAKIIPNHIKLIDLSADFRLKNSKLYKKWYGINHKSKELINKAIYSVTEFSKKNLHNHRIISCPGCYPTSIQIPLIPLVKEKMIDLESIIIDSKSGYSGAGRGVHKAYAGKNLYESIKAYGVGFHRHNSEIEQEIKKITKKNKFNITFTPHLSPMFKGILSTIYIETKKSVNLKKINNIYKKTFKGKQFVKIKKANTLISTNDVINTNNCQISVCKTKYKNKYIILSAIDNLIKGGSGQAVQNMNIKFNLPETRGLV